MNITFFNCKSSSERSFRCVICAIALAATLICFTYSAAQIIKSQAFFNFVMQSAFSTESVSELEAYRFRQTLISEELDPTDGQK